MAKLTLLQIVQRVLSAIDSDEVTTIDETVESEQVVLFVQTVYEDIMTDFPWYHKRSNVSLEATTTAHILSIPAEVTQLLSPIIYYGNKEVVWMSPENMNYLLKNRDTSLSNVDSNGAINDADPTYWSSITDDTIVFDSYDSSLVPSQTSVWAAVEPTSPSTDTDVPDMPHGLHIALLYGAIAEAKANLQGDEIGARKYAKQMRRQVIQAKRWARRSGQKENPESGVNYGRKRISHTYQRPSHTIIEGS